MAAKMAQRDFEVKLQNAEQLGRAERESIRMKMVEEGKLHQLKIRELKKQAKIRQKEQEREMKRLNGILTKRNYERTYPPPEFLRKFQEENPKAFTIQILGCRGAGKSTFLNKLMRAMGVDRTAKTGTGITYLFEVITVFNCCNLYSQHSN